MTALAFVLGIVVTLLLSNKCPGCHLVRKVERVICLGCGEPVDITVGLPGHRLTVENSASREVR